VIERRQQSWGIELAGFGRPFGLGVDRDGRLHVTDMDRHSVTRFTANLDLDEIFTAAGAWNGPHSIDFSPDGRAFVTCYYTPGIYVIGDPHPLDGAAALTGPASAFFDAAGQLLVAEYSQNAVIALDTTGRRAFVFDGRFDRPHMARSLADGRVIVADTWNNRLQRFDDRGGLLDDAVAHVSGPVAIDPDPNRGWLVTAWGDNCVVRCDANGRPAGRLEAPPLQKPYDARWLDGDRVAIADSHHGRVLVVEAPRFH
jgi:DNA-binding beta-propeller fold protein YncE